LVAPFGSDLVVLWIYVTKLSVSLLRFSCAFQCIFLATPLVAVTAACPGEWWLPGAAY
jgi:hypothetical protein